jgi:type IX secretion system substrate protein
MDGYSEYNKSSNLLYMNNRFYAATQKGGVSDHGVFYSYDPDTKKFTRIHDFKKEEPSLPYGNLIAAGDRELSGLTWVGPNEGYGGSYYRYQLPENKFEFVGQIGGISPKYYEHGTPDPYVAHSNKVYKVKGREGIEKAGIFMSYTATWDGIWTNRVFTFPDYIVPQNDRGLVESNNKLIGLAEASLGNGVGIIIYKYDLLTNAFSYKPLPQHLMRTPYLLTGLPVDLNNKTYILTPTGCLGTGSLIEWDNIADTIAVYCYEGRYLDGSLFCGMTVADGRLYVMSQKSIVCFDPVAKTFKTVYKPQTPFGEAETYPQTRKQLTRTLSNALPLISSINAIEMCLDDSLSRNIVFTATDTDLDTLKVTASYKDSALIRNCSVRVDTNTNGSVQYVLQVRTEKKEGKATIVISVADGFGGFSTMPVSLTTTSRKTVSLSFSIDTLCKKDTSIALTTGLPAGGVYKVDGIPGDTLKIGLLTEGKHVLRYVYPASGACRDSASLTFYVTECVAPNPVALPTMMPYPNPSSGTVKVDNSEQLLTTVHVFNGQGFKVFTKVSADNIIVLDLSHLQTGIYYITTINSKGTKGGKVEIVK